MVEKRQPLERAVSFVPPRGFPRVCYLLTVSGVRTPSRFPGFVPLQVFRGFVPFTCRSSCRLELAAIRALDHRSHLINALSRLHPNLRLEPAVSLPDFLPATRMGESPLMLRIDPLALVGTTPPAVRQDRGLGNGHRPFDARRRGGHCAAPARIDWASLLGLHRRLQRVLASHDRSRRRWGLRRRSSRSRQWLQRVGHHFSCAVDQGHGTPSRHAMELIPSCPAPTGHRTPPQSGIRCATQTRESRPEGRLRQRRAGFSTLLLKPRLGGWVEDHGVAEVFELGD